LSVKQEIKKVSEVLRFVNK